MVFIFLTLNSLLITQLPSVKLKHIIFLALVSKSWITVESSVHHVAVFCVRWLQFCKIVNHVQFTFNPYRQTLGAWHRRISWKLFPDISGKSPISWPKIVKSEKVRKKFAGYPLCQRPFLEVVSGIFLNGLPELCKLYRIVPEAHLYLLIISQCIMRCIRVVMAIGLENPR